MSEVVFIGLGSNLEQPIMQLNQALDSISNIEQTSILAVSPFYQTKPVGYLEQSDFQNAVVKLQTHLSPMDLLQALQSIEQAQGRIRVQKNGPRTIDLDILLFGNLTIESEELTIPHPRMYEREFVLKPLSDIAPELVSPSLLELIESV